MIGAFPGVTAVSPPARSFGIPYDVAPIWAQFDQPLDSTTITTRSVFLKIDQARQPAAVRWDAASRRIEIWPRDPLNLKTTYTVVIDTSITTSDGIALPAPVLWQFTTNTLHHVVNRQPLDGASDESPFVALAWSGNDSIVDPVRYDISLGTDSAAVANYASTMITSARSSLLPNVPWPTPAVLFWTVTATNLATGEVATSSVSHFSTLDPALAQLDSIVISPRAIGSINTATGFNACNIQLFAFGSVFTAYRYLIDWGLDRYFDASIRLAGARMRFAPVLSGGFGPPPPGSVQLLPTTSSTTGCGSWTANSPAPVPSFGPVAASDTTAEGIVTFASGELTAHLEATVRQPGYWGYMLQGTVGLLDASVPLPTLSIQYYRLPTRPRP